MFPPHIPRALVAAALCALPAFATLTASAEPLPKTWQEHWFEHKELLKLVASNADVAIYFDAQVSPDAVKWIQPFMTKVWQYTKKTYGNFNPENRLYCIFHQGGYSGGHPSTYFDASHDFRDVIDCGPGPWDKPQYDVPSHEVGHIVEGASLGIHGSPTFPLWRDSKWCEIYQYDLYLGLGMRSEAQRLQRKFSDTQDDFPRPGTHWFRDWYFPIWSGYGHSKVLAFYFKLLSEYFPKKTEGGGKNQAYARDINWGEYVHFMSGAAGKDLKPLATKAFGWPSEWEEQYQAAKKDFPKIKYTPAL